MQVYICMFIFILPEDILFFILFNKFNAFFDVSLFIPGKGSSGESLQECINSYIEHIPLSSIYIYILFKYLFLFII